MAAGVLCNLGILFYFKYFDFFIGNVNAVFGTSFLLKGILLPLGISFFTFQQIGFLVDTYRGEIRECTFLDYALFVSFFPQLIAGPIVNHNEMMPQFDKIGKQKLDWDRNGEEGFGRGYVWESGELGVCQCSELKRSGQCAADSFLCATVVF